MLKPSARKPLPNLTEVFCFSTVDEHRLLAGRNTSELDNNFYSMQHSPLKRIKQVDLYTEMAREGRYGLELVISSKTVVISSSNTPKKTPPLYGTANSERTVNVQAKPHVF